MSSFDSTRYYDCESRREEQIEARERAEAEEERREQWAEEECPDCGQRNRSCVCMAEVAAPAPGFSAEYLKRLDAELAHLRQVYGKTEDL